MFPKPINTMSISHLKINEKTSFQITKCHVNNPITHFHATHSLSTCIRLNKNIIKLQLKKAVYICARIVDTLMQEKNLKPLDHSQNLHKSGKCSFGNTNCLQGSPKLDKTIGSVQEGN